MTATGGRLSKGSVEKLNMQMRHRQRSNYNAPEQNLSLCILHPTPGLLKWRTAVRIRTFAWRRPDLVSLS